VRRGPKVFATASIFLALLALAVERRGPVYAHDYVANGGFEYGIAGWSSPSAELATVPAAEVAPFEDLFSGRVVLTQSAYIVRGSAVPAPPGTYVVTAAIKRAIDGPQVRVAIENQNTVFTERPGRDGWVIASSTFSVSNYCDLQVVIDGSGNVGDVFYVDAVHIDGPEPATPAPSATATPSMTPSPPATATGTRTPSPTRTPAATHTPAPETVPAILDNSLENGGFEDIAGGLPNAWRRYGGALTTVTSPVRSGGHSARFESATDSTKWLYQAVAVDGGGTYSFGAWVYHDDANVASAFLRVSWYASADAEGSSLSAVDSSSRLHVPAPGYRYLSTGPVSAPAGARSARLRIMLAPSSGAPAAIYVDDATFGPAAPDPEITPIPISAAEDAALVGDTQPGAASDHGADGHATSRALVTPPHGGTVGRVVINEVMYDPGAPADGEGDGEWVELYNAGLESVDLGGWSLADAASRDVLPSRVCGPGEFVVVAASDSFMKAYPSFSGTAVVLGGRIGNGLGNNGDRLLLLDASGAPVDAISWGRDRSILGPSIPDVPAGHSIERQMAGIDTDSASDFVDNLAPSPGGPTPLREVRSAHAISPDVSIEVLASKPSIVPGWLPWAATAASGVVLACAIGWRALPFLRRRLHFGA
jgi:hypothetical protein